MTDRAAIELINSLRAEQVENDYWYAKPVERDLRQHDPQLDLVRAKPQASAPGIVPGHWHVRRRNDGFPDFYMPITTPSGGYREPDSRVLSQLQERDLWRDENLSRLMTHDELLAQELKREQDAIRAERRDEILERVKSSTQTSVSLNGNNTR